MSTTIQFSQSLIQFQIFGATKTKIEIWKQKTLRKIWEEQMLTGTYKGQYPVKGNKIAELIMKRQAEARIFKPIYGMDSNCGFRYTFQIADKQCSLTIQNTLTKDQLRINEAVEPQSENSANQDALRFSICGKAFESLKMWSSFEKLQAIPEKYVYTFYVKFSGNACKMEVTDQETGEKFEVSKQITEKDLISV